GGVDSFRAPRVVGDSSALPGRYGVFFASQPEVERGTATRGSGCSIPVHQPAGESDDKNGRPGNLGGRQEEGTGGTLDKRGAHVATEREAARGEHQRFPQFGARQGASLWRLRYRAKSGGGQRGRHPRHG